MPVPRVLATFCVVLTTSVAQVSFDVASVRLTKNGRNAEGFSRMSIDTPSPGTFSAVNASLYDLTQWAYDVKDYQLSGPAWIKSDEACYDITAKTAPSASKKQIREMLQALLSERFELALRHESRVVPVYELVVAKNGPRLRAATEDVPAGYVTTAGGELSAPRVGMQRFANALASEIGRPVFDKTGLQGAFAITLEYAPLHGVNATDRPSIFAAIERELGLKLQSTKAPVQVLVVDRAERVPTEN
jgi:uncharacterized protein (TIGR03435 family)